MVLRFDGFWTPEGRFPRSLSFSKSALTLKPYACFYVFAGSKKFQWTKLLWGQRAPTRIAEKVILKVHSLWSDMHGFTF